MKKVTSAEAAKILRQLNEQLSALERREANTDTFLAALGEDIESARPEYDYAGTQEAIKALQQQICKVKHAINVFNTVTKVPGFDITIDEMLVYLPQLSSTVAKLSRMKDTLPKTRESTGYSRNSAVIDYRYANYDITQAAADYDAAAQELARAQTALDLVNSTAELELPI